MEKEEGASSSVCLPEESIISVCALASKLSSQEETSLSFPRSNRSPRVFIFDLFVSSLILLSVSMIKIYKFCVSKVITDYVIVETRW